MDSILPSQPETYSQLLKRSFLLYRLSFRKIIVFAFLLSLVVFIPRFISDAVGEDIFANLSPFSLNQLWVFVINLAGLLFFIAIVWHMHCVIINKHEPLSEDIRLAMRKVLYTFIASLIEGAILFCVAALVFGVQLLLWEFHHWLYASSFGVFIIGLVLLGNSFLLLYVSTLFVFFVPIIAIENKSLIASLERTVYLVWNHWFRAFSFQITPWICYIILLAFLKYMLRFNIHIYFADRAAHPLWTTLLQLVLFALFVPWVASNLLVQLKDLELRKNIAA
jgi:hypothetical protein